MYLSKIRLRNWKAYAQAEFDFPAPGPGQNIILIGARNGYGKTSLFEAIILGMFGRDGLPLIARSPLSAGEGGRLEPYSKFLKKALHRGATAAGWHSCSVYLTFVRGGRNPAYLAFQFLRRISPARGAGPHLQGHHPQTR
ncbi:MAG: AAA family ATPase [Rhodobacteraceae bacterium]|nr:AAA family ATPase [Paracoccaceae bacterium]